MLSAQKMNAWIRLANVIQMIAGHLEGLARCLNVCREQSQGIYSPIHKSFRSADDISRLDNIMPEGTLIKATSAGMPAVLTHLLFHLLFPNIVTELLNGTFELHYFCVCCCQFFTDSSSLLLKFIAASRKYFYYLEVSSTN